MTTNMDDVRQSGTPCLEGDRAGRSLRPGCLERIIAALRTVHDPEIPINIYDLGLVYAIDEIDEGDIAIRMTLTAPGCPVAGILPGQVEQAVLAVEGINRCRVELIWEPPWHKDMMSEAAKLELGLM